MLFLWLIMSYSEPMPMNDSFNSSLPIIDADLKETVASSPHKSDDVIVCAPITHCITTVVSENDKNEGTAAPVTEEKNLISTKEKHAEAKKNRSKLQEVSQQPSDGYDIHCHHFT